jgi:glycosyltransferase involved in cell wall biosynthesis
MLFCVPKSHNNLLPWVDLIIENGLDIEFLVIRKNIVHSQEVTELPGSYWMVNAARKFKMFKDPAKVIDLFFLPRISFLWEKIKSDDVSGVFVRFNFGFYFLATLVLTFFARKKLVLYSQGPFLSSKSFFKKIIAASVKFIFSGIWITPVFYKEYNSSKVNRKFMRYSTFIPFFHGTRRVKKEIVQNGELRVLILGKFIKRKRHQEMLKAIHEHNLGNIHFDIFGEINFEELSYYNECDDFLLSNNISNIVLYKNIPYREIQERMSDYDILVLMSDDETCSFSQIEAMSNGLAVIINADNGSANYVVHNINGFIVRPGEYDRVMSYLKKLEKDRNLLNMFKSNSIELMNGYENIARSMMRNISFFN